MAKYLTKKYGGGRTTAYCKNKKGESMGSLIPQISVKENYVPRNPSPEAMICMTCEKPTCRGICKRYRQLKAEIKKEAKQCKTTIIEK